MGESGIRTRLIVEVPQKKLLPRYDLGGGGETLYCGV